MPELCHIPPERPDRSPPLSHAVRHGGLLYVSGLPGFDEAGEIAIGDFTAQMRCTLANLDRVLAKGGSDKRHIIRATVWLTRESDVAEMNRLYAAWYGEGPYPARTTAVVKALPSPSFLLEIECIAAVKA